MGQPVYKRGVYLPLRILAGFDEIIQLNRAPSRLIKHLFALPQSLARIQESTMRQKGSCCHNLKCTCVTMSATRKWSDRLSWAWDGENADSTPRRRGSSGVPWEGRTALRMEMYRLFKGLISYCLIRGSSLWWWDPANILLFFCFCSLGPLPLLSLHLSLMGHRILTGFSLR